MFWGKRFSKKGLKKGHHTVFHNDDVLGPRAAVSIYLEFPHRALHRQQCRIMWSALEEPHDQLGEEETGIRWQWIMSSQASEIIPVKMLWEWHSTKEVIRCKTLVNKGRLLQWSWFKTEFWVRRPVIGKNRSFSQIKWEIQGHWRVALGGRKKIQTCFTRFLKDSFKERFCIIIFHMEENLNLRLHLQL